MSNPMFGNYASPFPIQSPQMQNQLNSQMATYQNLMSQLQSINPMIQPVQAVQSVQNVSEKGEFIKVKSFSEVEEAPTRLDGTATLFFDFANRVFWSKKFSNGGHSIQAFKFEPINSAIENSTNEVDYTKVLKETPTNNDVPNETEQRLSKIEAMLDELIANKNKSITSNNKKVKEDVKDEI